MLSAPKSYFGLMSKEAENLVLFERAEILDNLDQRFVSTKRIHPSKQCLTAKRRSTRGRDVVASIVSRVPSTNYVAS